MTDHHPSGRVLGIGGVFLRSAGPEALAAWYRDHLGIDATASGQPTPDGKWSWVQEAGDTIFSLFPHDADYFAPERQVMINFRVTGLDDLLSRLSDAGVAITHREEMAGVGRFARIHDPEGNPIELWEPEAD